MIVFQYDLEPENNATIPPSPFGMKVICFCLHLKILQIFSSFPINNLEYYTPLKKSRKCPCDCSCCLCIQNKRKNRKLEPGVLLSPRPLERTDAFYTGPASWDSESNLSNIGNNFTRHLPNQFRDSNAVSK